tara:strand:- start:2426 stop:2974 length:549 start_codon:yes stop_codon:yes gene_type:complete
VADVLAVAQVTGRSYGQKADEADRLTHAGIVRAASGIGDLYTDNNVTTISIGGGTANTLTVLASVATFTLTSNGSSYNLNAGTQALTTTAQTIVEAINEANTSGIPTVATYTVTAEEVNHIIDLGQAATGPFFVLINGVFYSSLEGWFVVTTTTFANDTWTWQDQGAPGQLKTNWNVLTWHY